MPIDTSAIGRSAGPIEVSWTSRDAMLYALGVGAGQENALDELQFTTENTRDVVQQVLPTYAVVIVQLAGLRLDMGSIDRTKLVHAEQAFVLHQPLSVEGRVRVSSCITSIQDKGSGALVSTEASVVDAATNDLLITTTSSVFIRGEGGFGGPRKEGGTTPMPERQPDATLTAQVRQDQALLYRLSGDRNPLHSDPAFAAVGGFERPILHGMCTYGITGRLLLRSFCGSDPARVRSMSARFTRPVMPGDSLSVQAWNEAPGVRFRTLNGAGDVVMDHGLMTLQPEVSA